MKLEKIVPFLILSVLVISGFGAVATPMDKPFETKILKAEFSEPVLVSDNEKIFIEVDEANSYLISDNKPLMPIYSHTFKFPIGTKIESIKCNPRNIQEQTLTNDLVLSPIPIPLGQKLSIENIQQSNLELNHKYPENWYDYDIGRGIDGDERTIFVKVDVSPTKYDPIKNTIEWAETFEMEIEYQTNQVNFEEEYNYIIITPDEFSSELVPLVTHKNNNDVLTKLVTLEEIYDGTYFPAEGRDDAEKVKYFIKNAYDTWGITYVMLVGGDDEFPTRTTHVKVSSDDQEIFLSDLYFADLYDEENQFITWDSNENDLFAEYKWDFETDEIDFYPDVHLGRIACTDEDEVETIVNKIMVYEDMKAYTKNWFNNIVVIGGDTVPGVYGDESGIDEGELVNQAILDIMEGFIPDKIWDSNNRLGSIAPTGVQNIKDGIDDGCGFVDFSGHGAPWVWTTYPHNGSNQILPTPTGRYTNSLIGTLENGNELPIVMCGGCSLGKYNSNDNCFAWSFLSNEDGGGIATFGATGLGYVYLGEYATEGLVEGLMINFFESYVDGAITFGEIWSGGINEYMKPNLKGSDWKTLMELQPFGDPTLAISEESTPPEKPIAPEGETEGEVGASYTYTTSTTDVDGDELYYLFEWGDGEFSNWEGPFDSGDTAEASHIFQSKGDFQIRVKAKDEHGKLSEWSDPLPITMPKHKSYQNTPIIQRILDFLTNFFPNIIDLLNI